jgi:hypothetical protein
MDIHQARPESTQEETKAKMNIHQEKMEAAIHSTQSELDEAIKHWMEDILLYIDLKTQVSARNSPRRLMKCSLTGHTDIHQYADKESPGNHNRHKSTLS